MFYGRLDVHDGGSVTGLKRGAVVARFVVLFCVLGGLSGCVGIGDIFVSSKKLVGGYELQQFEESSFYLCQPNQHCGGMSDQALDGRVQALGWSNAYLVLLMSGPAPAGWYVVDLKTQQVRGPMTDRGLRMIGNKEPELLSIVTRPVEEV